MDCAYLDVHVFDELFRPGGEYFSHLPRLHELVATNCLRVFGSARQLDELVGLLNKDVDAYCRMSEGALNLIGHYFLRSRAELCMMELRKRNQLSQTEACVPTALLEEFKRFVADPSRGRRIAEVVRREGEEYCAALGRPAAEALTQLAERHVTTRNVRLELGQSWVIGKNQIDQWILSCGVFRDHIGQVGAAELARWQMPVLRSWVAFGISHAYKTVADGRKIGRSDLGDWEHYAYAAIPGFFVTKDRRLKEIASHIKSPRVHIVTPEEFLARTGS